MDNFGYPPKGVYGYQSLDWAVNNFIQADYEYESLPSWSDEAIERYLEAVDAAVYLNQLIEGYLNGLHAE